jgi:hypothetical protein
MGCTSCHDGRAARLALWRALHADKVAARVEAKTEAVSGATDERLRGGARSFDELRKQNTMQGERITTLEARTAQHSEQVVALLELTSRQADRIAKLEARLDLKRQRIATNTARLDAMEAKLAELGGGKA